MDRIRRSWRLVKASLAVLAADKELLVFPILAFLATIVAIMAILWPAYFLGAMGSVGSDGDDRIGLLGYVVLFFFYLVTYTISIFSNSALVGMALMRLEGRDPTAADGWRVAASRGGIILQYAAFAATVGVLLNLLRDRGGVVGSTAAGIGGLAWNLATFLVVPVLVVDGCGPLEAVKRSTALLKRTWGEQIVGGAGMGLVFFLAGLGVVAVSGVILYVGAQVGSVALMMLAPAACLFTILALVLVNNALHAIYAAALYRYAMVGETGGHFDADLVQSAFRAR